VHVVGAVKTPGVYALPQGSRIKDAIQSAGGFLADADQKALNLAAFVEDGQRISAPFLQPLSASDTLNPGVDRSTQIDPGALDATPITTGLLDINSASQEELETLPGIGPVTAMAIIAYRQENGPFATIEDIQSVSGIGPKTFEKIKDLITTSP
jgi:competence protein ComEA